MNSEMSVCRAVIVALNTAIPKTHCRLVGEIGLREYRIIENPLDILNALRDEYGMLAPTKCGNLEAQWSAPWNPVVPIRATRRHV